MVLQYPIRLPPTALASADPIQLRRDAAERIEASRLAVANPTPTITDAAAVVNFGARAIGLARSTLPLPTETVTAGLADPNEISARLRGVDPQDTEAVLARSIGPNVANPALLNALDGTAQEALLRAPGELDQESGLVRDAASPLESGFFPSPDAAVDAALLRPLANETLESTFPRALGQNELRESGFFRSPNAASEPPLTRLANDALESAFPQAAALNETPESIFSRPLTQNDALQNNPLAQNARANEAPTNNIFENSPLENNILTQNNALANNALTQNDALTNDALENDALANNVFERNTLLDNPLANNTLAANPLDNNALENSTIQNVFERSTLQNNAITQNDALENNAIARNTALENEAIRNDVFENNRLENNRLTLNDTLQNNPLENDALETNTLRNDVFERNTLQNGALARNDALTSPALQDDALAQSPLLGNNAPATARPLFDRASFDATEQAARATQRNAETLFTGAPFVPNRPTLAPNAEGNLLEPVGPAAVVQAARALGLNPLESAFPRTPAANTETTLFRDPLAPNSDSPFAQSPAANFETAARRGPVANNAEASLFRSPTDNGPDGDLGNGTDRAETLSAGERRELQTMERNDRAVRADELSQRAAAGGYADGTRVRYQVGPDGRRYAVDSQVTFDTTPVPGDPGATLRKMEVVSRAATAATDPSATDRSAAAEAQQLMRQARAQLAAERYNETIERFGR
jgi:hypothetical protein